MMNEFLLNFYLVGVTSGRINVEFIPNPYRDEIKRQLGLI